MKTHGCEKKKRCQGSTESRKWAKGLLLVKTNKLAWVGEWNSGLRICDFKHKLHTVFLGKSVYSKNGDSS